MTIDDQRLHDLLRAALPPSEVRPPARDLWLDVLTRDVAPTRGSRADFGIAVLVGLVLLWFPQWIWFLAYHL